MDKTPTGSKILDRMLEGGYETDTLTTIYGPAGSGKTNLCLLAGTIVARKKKKVIYIDTEGSFSIERLKQIAPDYKELLNHWVLLKPSTFHEQQRVFEKLNTHLSDNVGLIIVDTIAMLYRLELGKSEDIYEINRELGRQIAYLSGITRKKGIPVLLANQVYADMENRERVKIVGGDILKYGSKCLIELQITRNGNRRAILRKHRSIQEEKQITFKIVEGGIIGTKEANGFRR
ncbi:DNA repair and recombination protein RadB [Candidatus Woesearchaeota archaeon]|nr:DNA repair and recombination protein RadB [Candidatus Woesearchaeota archaeon]